MLFRSEAMNQSLAEQREFLIRELEKRRGPARASSAVPPPLSSALSPALSEDDWMITGLREAKA